MLTKKLNAIASLTDPAAIAQQFKTLSNQEAVYIALFCAIEWCDDPAFLGQILTALDVPQYVKAKFAQTTSHKSDKAMIEFFSTMPSPEYSAWAALCSACAVAKTFDYKKMGHLANIALKQLELTPA